MPKVKPLIYPFTYEEWLAHPSTKPKLRWIKKVCDKMRKQDAIRKKYGEQLKIF